MSKLRSLSTSFWSDPFIEDLTPIEKLLFIYLITNDKTNMLGIYESSVKKISFETGIDKVDVENALKGFERLKKVKYINNFVILVNYLKHQNFNTNMKKSAIEVFNNLPNCLKDKNLSLDKTNPSESFETLSNHLLTLRKIEVEVEVEVEVEREEEREVKVEEEITPSLNNEVSIIGPLNNSEEKEKNKSSAKKRKEQISPDCKKYFLDYYLKEKGVEFYWTAAESVALNKLIQKIRSISKNKPDSEVLNLFYVFVDKIKASDQWVYDNLSIRIMNQKFNEIIPKMKKVGADGRKVNVPNGYEEMVNGFLKTINDE